MNILPYVYLCIHKNTGHFYIGYREANKLPAELDLPIYKTSSKTVKSNFSEFDWHIVAEFFDADSAYNFEQQLINENWGDELLLNKSCFFGKEKFKHKIPSFGMLGKKHSKQTKQKMTESRKSYSYTNEHKKNISKANTGKKHTSETKTKISESKKLNRVCRLKDKKEMDVGNFFKYL